jgi:hypothetical protein
MSDYGGDDGYGGGDAGYEYVHNFHSAHPARAALAHRDASRRMHANSRLTMTVTEPSTSTRSKNPMSLKTTTIKPAAQRTQTAKMRTMTTLWFRATQVQQLQQRTK